MRSDCSVLKTSSFIGKKWALLIFLELYKKRKEKRYNELLRGLNGITPKVLSQRLKEMQLNGLVEKRVDASTKPVSSIYSLTSCGKDLINITREYKNWVLKWKTKNELCKHQDCEKCQF